MDAKNRKTGVILLGSGLLLLFLLLGALNAFNLPFLRPHSAGLIFLFTALSVVAFLLFVVLLVLLLRNILKLYADQRSRVLGSRLRTRMLIGALLLSFAPALFMFLFSYGLMNRSMDRWFSQPVMQLRNDSTAVTAKLAQYAAANARAEAEAITNSAALNQAFQQQDFPAVLNHVRAHRITLQGGFVIVYHNDLPICVFQRPADSGPTTIQSWLGEASHESPERVGANEAFPTAVLKAAQRSAGTILSIGRKDYALGSAVLPGEGLVVTGLPMPEGLGTTVSSIQNGAEIYWATFKVRNRMRRLSLSILLLLTALIFFTSSWLALFLSKQITRPVEALADAMDEIGEGHYGHRVTVAATEELGELIRSFNHMAADLEENRTLAQTSTRQLFDANRALEERRRELETVLETIPSGVVSLDADLRVLQANRAFHDLMEPNQETTLIGQPLQRIFPAEIADELTRLVRRSQRMGVAATEFEMRGPNGTLNLSATLASLNPGASLSLGAATNQGLMNQAKDRRGCILVLEDVTEFLRAQRQVAWKEVAQRIAHEIKNPLTPISLSAERVRKHIDRPTPDSPNIIRKCSEVILGSVASLRTLVDQFAALAQFPTAQPRPTDLNQIVESALLLFAGRLDRIEIVRHLSAQIPPVMADPEALKRAFANLIDNAAEAMQGSLLRQLTVETSLAENQSMAEIVVADTGHGLTPEMRERLFLPYFSTKQRGTGLGLAIAAKIVQEHHGEIRAEQNTPAGARFILELPLAEAGISNGSSSSNGHTAKAAIGSVEANG